jgi:hypothetical protein
MLLLMPLNSPDMLMILLPLVIVPLVVPVHHMLMMLLLMLLPLVVPVHHMLMMLLLLLLPLVVPVHHMLLLLVPLRMSLHQSGGVIRISIGGTLSPLSLFSAKKEGA